MTVDRIYEEVGQFPVGMRVLAVDDDPICLKLLETLLRKCRYHVTTTSQAIMALKLLRENKDKFDLVISDVHMPDMDGFKLLELVGLEMNLPVIMLSANGDTKLVMKGIIHGACDYLLKPVRMEELKNIWQHVVRRKKKVHPNGKNNSDKIPNENDGRQALPVTDVSDQNCKLNRKRKDQKEEDDEDRENEPSNEDSSTQKKARLVWSGDLHRKFVAAVRTLGIDNAFPKKILETMNVEKLTRENVASHLQKYRKYLYRISCVTSQQANMVAALGGPDAAYLRMTSLSGHGNLQNTAVRPFSSSGLLGSRLNTPVGLPMPAPPLIETIQLASAQNLNNPLNIQPTFQPVMIPGNQNGNIHGMPVSLEQQQLDNNVCNYSEPLPRNLNQICGAVPLSSTESPSDLPNFGRCTDSWSACQTNPFTSSDRLKTTNPRDYGNMFSSPVSSFTVPSVNGTSDLRADFNDKLQSDFSAYQNPNLVCNSMNLMNSSHGFLGSTTQYYDNFDNKSSGLSRSDDLHVVEIQSLSDQQLMQQIEDEQSVLQTAVQMKQGYLMGQPNPLDGYSYNGGNLEDLVSAMRKLDQDMLM